MEDNNDYWLEESSAQLLYEIPLPHAISVPPGFISGELILLLDGFFDDFMPEPLTLTFTDQNSLEVFRLTFSANDQIAMSSHVVQEKVSSTLFSEGEPFYMKILFDEGKHEFSVVDNYFSEEYFSVPLGIHDLSPMNLLVSGSISVNVLGFVAPGIVMYTVVKR